MDVDRVVMTARAKLGAEDAAHIRKTLKMARGNRAKAARLLDTTERIDFASEPGMGRVFDSIAAVMPAAPAVSPGNASLPMPVALTVLFQKLWVIVPGLPRLLPSSPPTFTPDSFSSALAYATMCTPPRTSR